MNKISTQYVEIINSTWHTSQIWFYNQTWCLHIMWCERVHTWFTLRSKLLMKTMPRNIRNALVQHDIAQAPFRVYIYWKDFKNHLYILHLPSVYTKQVTFNFFFLDTQYVIDDKSKFLIKIVLPSCLLSTIKGPWPDHFFDPPTYLKVFEILVPKDDSYFSHSRPEIWRSKIGYLQRNNQKCVK